MKILLGLFAILFLTSCHDYKNLIQGDWEYSNENGDITLLRVRDDNFESDYCYKQFPIDSLWQCIEIEGVIKFGGKKYLNILLGPRHQREILSYRIQEFNQDEFTLEKLDNQGNVYTTKYLKSD